MRTRLKEYNTHTHESNSSPSKRIKSSLTDTQPGKTHTQTYIKLQVDAGEAVPDARQDE